MSSFSEKKLLIATHNQGKFEEFKSILGDLDLKIMFAKDLNLSEPKETKNTFLGNARIKARSSCQASKLPSLADDSGIEVHALNNQPGVHTADWAETKNGRDFKKAMNLLWNKLTLTKKQKPFSAEFCCTLVLAFPNGGEKIFEGRVAGEIVWPMRGPEGHGYDPIFLPKGYSKTFGEMKEHQKNRISHRYKALRKFINFYQEISSNID